MDNYYWLPILISIPLAFSAVLMLARNFGGNAARWIALVGTLVTLTACLALSGAYYRFVTEFPAATVDSAGQPADVAPVKPLLKWHYPWLSLSGPASTATFDHATRLEFFLGVDGVSVSLILLTGILFVSSVLISWEAIADRRPEFYAFMLLLEAGLIGVFCAFDLLLFYVFFEFTLIPLFFLVGIWGGPDRRRAAVKLFLYTLAGGLVTLVGLAALIAFTWQRADLTTPFSIPALASSLAATPLSMQLQVGIFLAIAAGFFIKVPLFPFHTWLPLAHVEAPTAGSILLAGVLLKLGTYGFFRICLPLLPGACYEWGAPLIGTMAVIGIVYGSLCSLAQRDIKKLIAYSSVAHLGFCMVGLFSLNREGMTGGVLQMINHGLSTGALFLLVGMVYERYHTRMLDDLGGLAKRLPLIAVAMVFISMASIGLPGLNGFVGEFLSLAGMYRLKPAYAVIGATGVILGAWYLLTMLQHAFFGPLKEPEIHGHGSHDSHAAHDHHAAHSHANHGHGGHGHGHAEPPLPDNGIRDINLREFLALAPLAALCLAIGVYPKPLIDTIKPDINAVAHQYDKLKVPMRGRQWAPEEVVMAAPVTPVQRGPINDGLSPGAQPSGIKAN
ncbi:MAG TPA: NADH-quinone oxidoreductase subunit M [Caulifigura sp.]|nr:NADH-quinone oxidoreductase subunit M [Caulifigura sp.]